MPRVFEPKVARVGPLGKRVKKAKKKDTKRVFQSSASKPYASSDKAVEEPLVANNDKESPTPKSAKKTSFIGEDLLEWRGEPANVRQKVATVFHRNKPNVVRSSKSTTRKPTPNKKTDETMTDDSIPSAKIDKIVNNDNIHTKRRSVVELGRRAVALDTRCLHMPGAGRVGESVVESYQELIATMGVRGISPAIVATTIVDENKKAIISTTNSNSGSTVKEVFVSGIGVKAHVSRDGDPSGWVTDLLLDVPCELKHDSSSCDRCADGPFVVPKTMTAELSWLTFRDLVDAVISKDKEAVPVHSGTHLPPLDITIVTTDVALFSDCTVESHKQNAARFAKHVASRTKDRPVSSIQIVVAKMGNVCLKLVATPKCNGGETEAYQSVTATDLVDHESEMKLCLESIQGVIDDLAFSGNSSNYGTNMTLSSIDGTVVGFKSLSRHFIRETLSSSSARTARLVVDLPVTADGTSCSVAFDASYSVIPFSLGTSQASMLLSDIGLMAKQCLKVVRRLPLASLDASLLFGVPLTLESGFENDISLYQETAALCCSLLRVLQEKQEALLLVWDSVTGGANESKGLFHQSHSSKDLFVLMTQEVPGGRPPSTGLLFRMAHVDQLLQESLSTGKSGALVASSELDAQYAYYVGESLETLECRPYNPIIDQRCGKDDSSAIENVSVTGTDETLEDARMETNAVSNENSLEEPSSKHVSNENEYSVSMEIEGELGELQHVAMMSID